MVVQVPADYTAAAAAPARSHRRSLLTKGDGGGSYEQTVRGGGGGNIVGFYGDADGSGPLWLNGDKMKRAKESAEDRGYIGTIKSQMAAAVAEAAKAGNVADSGSDAAAKVSGEHLEWKRDEDVEVLSVGSVVYCEFQEEWMGKKGGAQQEVLNICMSVMLTGATLYGSGSIRGW